MRLFSIEAEDANGSDLGLFVWAQTPKDAKEQWETYYGRDENDDQADLIAVWEIPLQPSAEAQAIRWENIKDHTSEALR